MMFFVLECGECREVIGDPSAWQTCLFSTSLFIYLAAWIHGEPTLLIVTPCCYTFWLWSLDILSVSCVALTYCYQMSWLPFGIFSVLSSTTYCLRLILYVVCPSPRLRHILFKEFWLLFFGTNS